MSKKSTPAHVAAAFSSLPEAEQKASILAPPMLQRFTEIVELAARTICEKNNVDEVRKYVGDETELGASFANIETVFAFVAEVLRENKQLDMIVAAVISQGVEVNQVAFPFEYEYDAKLWKLKKAMSWVDLVASQRKDVNLSQARQKVARLSKKAKMVVAMLKELDELNSTLFKDAVATYIPMHK